MFRMERGEAQQQANLHESFTAARELLKFFYSAASSANLELDALEQKYDAHQEFKERRMLAFGWSRGSDEIVDEEDDGNDDVESDLYNKVTLF